MKLSRVICFQNRCFARFSVLLSHLPPDKLYTHPCAARAPRSGTYDSYTTSLSNQRRLRSLNMTPQIEITELIAKPLDVIAQLRADLKAETDAGDGRRDGDGSDAVAAAISEMLCAGDCLALNEVPVLSRKSLAEV